MTLRLQPVQVANRGDDTEGLLVFANESLVGVLVRLSALHECNAGRWFLEVGFGALNGCNDPIFSDLDEAQAWISQRLA